MKAASTLSAFAGDFRPGWPRDRVPVLCFRSESRNRFSRSLVTALLFLLLGYAGTSATLACQGRQFERPVLFEQRDIAAGIDAPFIVEVTIESITDGPDNSLLARARVHRWIKGVLEGDQILLAVIPWSCDRGLAVGARGIVAGAVTPTPQGRWKWTDPICARVNLIMPLGYVPESTMAIRKSLAEA